MNTALKYTVALAALSLAAQAAPFLAVGDNAELFLTGTLGIRADDNVLLSNNKKSDIIYQVSPGLDLVFGNNALTKGHLFYKLTSDRYSDHSILDTNLSSIGFTSAYDDQKLKMNLDASFDQLAQNTVDTVIPNGDSFARRDLFKVSGGSEISMTEKSSIGAGVSYDDTKYIKSGFDDSKITTIPVNFFYEVTPKVDMSFGFRYRDTKLTTGSDSRDAFYSIGARGEFTPKLSGTLAVGYTQRTFSKNIDSESTPGIDTSLTYAASEKTSIRFGVSNDYGVSGTGATQRNMSYNFGVQSKLSEEWSTGFTLSYRSIAYLGTGSRTDKYFEGGLNATYMINAVVSVVGGYTYRNNDSALAGSSFNNSVFSLSANFRY
ncbi:MAG: outer membrane beta-barrel protein [Opitutaceae bacterium]|jgi:hypothetical protein